MPKPHAEFCTTREAARLLGVAPRTVQLWTERGVLRAWKTPGGHRRIARASVDRLARSRPRGANGSRPAGRQRRFRLLVVEDDPTLLALFAARIARWRLPVELATATNGYDGLIRAGRRRPDLLVTDLNMPGMDGFGMVRALRASESLRDLETVVVTALDAAGIAAHGGLPRGVRVLAKPVDFAKLEALVRRRLASPRARRTARLH
ncbi:MAG: response regulator [Burkholderiales bacterium]|nr:response regulator [Burkholderiales bacterium]